MTAGVLVISHSADLARGVVEVASQMGEAVPARAAGGMDDGATGTSIALVGSALGELLGEVDEVVVLYDLGSAQMTAEWAIEALDDDEAKRVTLVDGPLVEGALAAVVAIAQGGGADKARAAVAETAAQWDTGSAADTTDGEAAQREADKGGEGPSREVTVHDPAGMHARPAAAIATETAGANGPITINGADATSVLALMGLGIKQGETVTVQGSSEDDRAAVDAIVGIIEAAGGQ